MQIGEVLTSGMSTRTPWFDRPADNAVFTYEIISNSGSGTIDVNVLHKNYEETGDGTDTSVTWSPATSAVGFHTGTVTGLREQVRFEIAVTGDGASVLYRILPPTAYNTATTP